MPRNLIIPIFVSCFCTIIFLVAIIGFQADLANIFGISSIKSAEVSVLKDIVLPIFSAFGGAISGAYIAFELQRRKEQKITAEKELSHINRTIFTLHMQLTDLGNIKDQIFLPHADNPLRFLLISPMANANEQSERVNMEFAQTLIDNNEPQLAQDILLAEKKILNAS